MAILKKTLTLAVAAATLCVAAPALADDVKLGFLADVTGPIAGFAGGMVTAGNLVVDQVNAQGGILDGQKLVSVMADGACSADTAGPAADRLVNSENVTAIFGAYCTGATLAALNTAALPGNVVMISPSASAPTVTTIADNDLLYRTVVSDAFQGAKGADLLLSMGIKEVGITYVNGDYGKGLADQFASSFTAGGGKVLANVAHEDGKADYRPEIGQIESTGATTLIIYGYENAGGGAILNQAIESGSFTQFLGGDGMAGDALIATRDAASLEGLILTQAAAASGEAYDIYAKLATDAGLVADTTYGAQSYDAVFALALAIEKNGTADRANLSTALRDVTSAPGETILPGEWTKAVALIKAGTDINYEGASSNLDFDAAGDIAGGIDYFVIEGGKIINKGLIE
ncbi:MAG TPA: ABC transporter substrate-binding protein [Devosia sp.]|jgi:branched-chain amino acid transport system substrate-binding protein|nr:ABC transporter substrate-binding protein [Devosia sp.]